MVKIAVRRLLQLVPVLVGLSVVLFLWVRALPGDPAASMLAGTDTNIDAQAQEEIRRLYGLDRPVLEQYGTWVSRAAHLDFGQSIVTRRAVTTEIRQRFPATVELTAAALVLAVAVGVPLGYFTARRSRTRFDRLSTGLALLAVSIPSFLLAFLLKYVFSVKLGWLPSVGRQDATRDAAHPSGFYLVDAVVTGDAAAFADALRHLVLPAIALAATPAAFLARIARASVLEVAAAEHVRTAEAKGLGAGTVGRRHVLRNALLPVTTVVGLTAGFLLSGAALVEIVFAWGGMGSLLQQAIAARDYPVLQGAILFVAVAFVLVNLVVDLGYALLDPRVRIE